MVHEHSIHFPGKLPCIQKQIIVVYATKEKHTAEVFQKHSASNDFLAYAQIEDYACPYKILQYHTHFPHEMKLHPLFRYATPAKEKPEDCPMFRPIARTTKHHKEAT